jgi:uncharacterized protein (TIGR02145 family)
MSDRPFTDFFKIYNMNGIIVLASLLFITFKGLSQTSGTFSDTRDGQTYDFVVIGNQTWMAENLNYPTPDSWCYGDSLSNCDKYGRLYTWATATIVCPDNWHLPSEEEWKILEQFIGMSKEETEIYLYRGEGKGTKLKSKSDWGNIINQDTAFNATGFNALPSGFRMYTDGSFTGKKENARWWSSTTEVWEGTTYAFRRCIYSDKTGIDRDVATRTLGFSVRCVKNQ